MRRFLFLLFVLSPFWVISPLTAAEVTFGGDARARVIVRDDTLFGNADVSTIDTFDNRVRLLANAKAEGGAFAKARLRFDNKWGSDFREGQAVRTFTDLAYFGIPIKSTTLEAGHMRSNLTRFFEWDQRVDQLAVDFKLLNAHWRASFRMINEGQNSLFEINRLEDNDEVAYGLVGSKEFNEIWYAQAHLFYQDDQRNEFVTGQFIDPASGFFGSVFLRGKYTKVAVESELAYKAGNVRQSRDETGVVINPENVLRGDGWGWYAAGTYKFDSLSLILNLGVAVNGYEADNDFGWIMIGNGNTEPISVIPQLGANGDWGWIAPSLSYQFTEALSLSGNLVWVSIDAIPTRREDSLLEYESLLEVSGHLEYMISEGAALTWKFGWLKPQIKGFFLGEEVREDTAFATYARLQINF